MPLYVSSTRAHRQEVKIVLYSLWYHHTETNEWSKIIKISKITNFLFLNINQLDALNFIISIFHASTCFEHMCLSSGGQKLYYTVSGIITPKQVSGLKLLK